MAHDIALITVSEDTAENGNASSTLNNALPKEAHTDNSPILYNFATGAMDAEGFDFKRWKHWFIGYALRDTNRLMTYGQLRR